MADAHLQTTRLLSRFCIQHCRISRTDGELELPRDSLAALQVTSIDRNMTAQRARRACASLTRRKDAPARLSRADCKFWHVDAVALLLRVLGMDLPMDVWEHCKAQAREAVARSTAVARACSTDAPVVVVDDSDTEASLALVTASIGQELAVPDARRTQYEGHTREDLIDMLVARGQDLEKKNGLPRTSDRSCVAQNPSCNMHWILRNTMLLNGVTCRLLGFVIRI